MIDQSPYRTIEGIAQAEFEDRKSRFIGHVTRVSSADEVVGFRHGIMERIPEASHYVSAYVLHGTHIAHYSDAKEPRGTAGLPVLNVIQHLGLEDACCVVARIFGGTLLGRGGLTRAYTKAAQAAFEAARIVTCAPCRDILVSIGYTRYEQVSALLADLHARILDVSFADDVSIQFRVPAQEAEVARARVSDICNGRAEFIVGDVSMELID